MRNSSRIFLVILFIFTVACVTGCRAVNLDQARRDFIALRYVQDAQTALSDRPVKRSLAVKRLDRAMELAPDEHTVRQLAPGLYVAAREYEKALALLEKEPGADNFLLAQCLLMAGDATEGTRLLLAEVDAVNEEYRSGRLPEYAYAMQLNNAGYIFADAGIELSQAKNLLEIAVDRLPLDYNCLDSLGWAYYRLGMNKLALFYLERAVRMQPVHEKHSEILYHAGMAYFKVGNFAKAKKMLNTALKLDPEHKLIQEELRRIHWVLPGGYYAWSGL